MFVRLLLVVLVLFLFYASRTYHLFLPERAFLHTYICMSSTEGIADGKSVMVETISLAGGATDDVDGAVDAV